jgi:uncharacterized protein (TIGR00299 family) protein
VSRILYLDLIGGAAGDMLMAALVDAGAPLEAIRAAVAALGLDDVVVETKEVRSAGLRARQVDVIVRGELADLAFLVGDAGHTHLVGVPELRVTGATPAARGGLAPHLAGHAAAEGAAARAHGHRRYVDIRTRLESAPGLGVRARAIALQAFRWLAEAEARAHGVAVEAVEFHEVGADDAIADVVGVATAIEALAPDEIVVSPVPVARGLVRGAHGPIPLPGPAALEILLGVPLAETPLVGELVTPTGAALLRALATRFGPVPSMIVDAVGTGAGHKVWPDRPNVVRALVGRRAPEVERVDGELVLEANVDDLSPQHVPGLEAALLAAGALDVWATPTHMKKGRPGLVVGVLAPAGLRGALEQVLFRHSTTLGVRAHAVTRTRLARRERVVETVYGPIRVKVADRPDAPPLQQPEHDDVAAAARAHGTSERVVWEAALAAAWRAEG